jgi:hypothetical protein
MKSYKTTNNLSKNINYIKYQQSDIFSQKGLNKPEIKYTHKKLIPKKTFESSYNFLEWRDMSPHYDQSIKVKLNPNNISQILSSKTNQYLNYDLNKINKKKIYRKNFIQRLFEIEPEKVMNQSNSLNKNLNKRYQKETLFIGDYDGDEYKIKRTKSVIKEPPINFGEQNPLNKKMEIIYGGNENIIGDYKPLINLKKNMIRSKSCLGFLKKEFETNNDHDNNIINDPKKMKYFNIYGNNGIENANKKLKSLNVSHSMNNIYTPKNSCKQNRINFLKSNIFNNEEENEKDKNKINNNHTIKVNRHLQKNKKYKRANSASKLINKYYTNKNNNEIKDNNDSIINNKNKSIITEIKNNARKFLYKNNGEDNLPVKLDWRDEKSHLLFPQNKNRDILKKNCRERKFKNLYDSEPILPKEKLGQEFKSDKRSEIEKMAKNYYKNKNYAKIRKLSDNISQFQIEGSNKVLNDINYNTENIQGIKYEIIQKNYINNYSKITTEELEKKFAKKGLHIYDIKENMNSLMNNKNMNKITFKLRENQKDEKAKEKIKEIKNEFINNKILMKIEEENKKQNNDLMPNNLKWTTPLCDLIIKNKKFVNTYDGAIHLKGKCHKKNEEEKITRIQVNLKYKNQNINK